METIVIAVAVLLSMLGGQQARYQHEQKMAKKDLCQTVQEGWKVWKSCKPEAAPVEGVATFRSCVGESKAEPVPFVVK